VANASRRVAFSLVAPPLAVAKDKRESYTTHRVLHYDTFG
jgi:hypothetical protein